MKNWFVIQTKPHQELKVHTLLSRGGYEVYYPKTRETYYRGRVPCLALKPLFPSYVFIHVDFAHEHNLHLIKFTRGVTKILCSGEVPIAVSPAIISEIQARTDAFGILDWRGHFSKGQKVRIRRGPFKDLVGILEKPAAADERVRVLLQVINYKVNAAFHYSELESLSPVTAVPT